MFAVCVLFDKVIKSNSLSTILQIIFGAISYFVCLLILKDKIIIEIINVLKEKIKVGKSKN